MRPQLNIGALALVLVLAGCGDDGANNQSASVNTTAPLNQIAAPNNGDWTQVVSETPEGGYRMGNPDAPVKLVEYASITCPHCAEFSEAGSQPLQNQYVRSGQVSWEFRPYAIFPTDPAIFALLRCQGPSPFFLLTEQLYASQREWSGRLQGLSQADAQQLQGMSPTAQASALVSLTGVDQFFRQRGMPEGRINSCLADGSGLQRVVELTQQGSERDEVTGTPTFLINGVKADVGTWPELEQRLRAAIG